MQGSLAQIGPCGGSGGVGRDMDMSGVYRVVMVDIKHDATIDSMRVLYERDGLQHWTDWWGDRDGICSKVPLDRNEYLTNVKGYVGMFNGYTCVRSLTFVSNLRSYGPFGKEEGMPFQLPAVSGKILGFHARSGGHLDALGTYVKTD
ncbi:hypothetical protein QYE76_048483 [Lolium multiflorum]|uniref:Jacalin-type lectin domain-containing protein n=1 Tax=Lolium multiflorum TaxID=4521 RepID=A0AAD8WFE7_LOLMU|nr:hypothetical protein QYE76_048483 [Lolium multiflorum]